MTQTLLVGVLRLFAVLTAMEGADSAENGRSIVTRYLVEHLNLRNSGDHLLLFDDFFEMAMLGNDDDRKQTIWNICSDLCQNLPREEHFILLANLLTLCSQTHLQGTPLEAILASAMDMEWQTFQNIVLFINSYEKYEELGPDFLILDNDHTGDDLRCVRLEIAPFQACCTLLHIRETETLLLMPSKGGLTVNDRMSRTGYFQVLPPGAVLRDLSGHPCYYSQLSKALHLTSGSAPIRFEGHSLDFRFPGSDNGLHSFSFRQESGQMVAIMGGSGTGKSTLLNILNGTLAPDSGELLINGRNLYTQQDELEGVIGYVPQDDLLFEDMTVAQNLYYGARLCLDNLSQEEIQDRVDKTLTMLGQLETRDLKVGSSLDKTISGGQRKRLNIALELIRKPAILFADEPTSGLSSSDSLNVISLLREQANNGCLVFVVIHQPSFQIFQMFDSLWVLDKGGRPIYDGNPMEAVTYFRTAVHQSGAEQCVCPTCGNVNLEQIFDIIEMKHVDERGRFTDTRVISPEQWHQRYLERSPGDKDLTQSPDTAPPRRLWRPGLWGQFSIFLQRNLLTRMANKQYLVINLLEAPLIGLVLAWLCRGGGNGDVTFGDNNNVAMFLFMSVIVTIFMGLSVSAEEIVRDRKILKREQFLNLSRLSYINGKCVFLAGVTAVQVLSFMLVAFSIMKIPDMYASGFAVLFSAGFCSCLLGLNVSASLRSVVAIYILVPLLLIPQMLLSGSVIDFDELGSRNSLDNFVPAYAELMPSRWAYEALVTEQYAHNTYMEPLFTADCGVRQADFRLKYLLEEIKSLADRPFLAGEGEDVGNSLKTVRNEIRKVEEFTGIDAVLGDEELDPGRYGREEQKKVRTFVSAAGREIRKERSKFLGLKKAVERKRRASLGRKGAREFRDTHTNVSVRRVALGSMHLAGHRVQNGHVVQLTSPVCKPVQSRFGRAHFGAAYKRLGDMLVPTLWFNLAMLWLLTGGLFLCLYTNLFLRLASCVAGLRRRLG